jgi:asparagine synthase (glutamine-hydrolysing)
LSEFARKHVTVALSGEGSDEIFGGYRRYVAEGLFAHYPAAVGLLNTRFAQAMVSAVPKLRRWQKLLDALSHRDAIKRYASWLWIFSDEMRAELFSPKLAEQSLEFDPLDIYYRLYPQNGVQTTDRLLYLDQKTWLPDTYLEKVDKTSMGVGLEVRVPFLDHELVEFAATIPAQYKVRGFSTKCVLKKAVAPLLPAQTLRKRKHGFAVPLDPWIAGNLRGFVGEVLFDPKARSRGLFNNDYVDKLYRWHIEGKGSYHRHLWLLVVFELWCQQYLDSSPGARAASAA